MANLPSKLILVDSKSDVAGLAHHTNSLITKKSAAFRLRVGITTLDGFIKSGELPHVKIGRSVRIRETDLDNLIEKFIKKSRAKEVRNENND